MPTIAVVGSKKSGKTTAVEVLVKGLTKRGYKVATAKHVPEIGFTLDTKGKDTWRHAKAGANIVISVAPNELTVVKKVDTTKYSLEEIIRECEDEVEIVILEGFGKLIGQNPTVPKIVAVKKTEEILEASKHFKPILAFVGLLKTKEAMHTRRVSYIDVVKEEDRLVDLAEKKIRGSIRRKGGKEEN